MVFRLLRTISVRVRGRKRLFIILINSDPDSVDAEHKPYSSEMLSLKSIYFFAAATILILLLTATSKIYHDDKLSFLKLHPGEGSVLRLVHPRDVGADMNTGGQDEGIKFSTNIPHSNSYLLSLFLQMNSPT